MTLGNKLTCDYAIWGNWDSTTFFCRQQYPGYHNSSRSGELEVVCCIYVWWCVILSFPNDPLSNLQFERRRRRFCACIYPRKECIAPPYRLSFVQTVSVLYTFYLVMTLFPDIQTKAQEEIDHVVGNDRLPVLADRDNLPYINALQSEVYRWRPVVPTGLS